MNKLFFVICAVLFFGTACGLNPHNPEKARDAANAFLKELYIDSDLEQAIAMTDKEFLENYDKDYLGSLSRVARERFGGVEGFKPDFYVKDPGDMDIQLYYSSIAEKGIIYSRILLRKDENGEYRISGITSSPLPHEEFRTARQFKAK